VAVSFIGGIPNVAEQNLLILEEEKQIWFRVFVKYPNVKQML
jgi:hypothetical protein